MSETFEVPRANGRWRIVDGLAKLALRGALPGAYNYDRTAFALRQAIHTGVPAELMLAPAMPASWMVNNRAPSPVLKTWLARDAAPRWRVLLASLGEDSQTWLSADAGTRDAVEEAVSALAASGHGACAISKVLALLCPDTVPLMDDAAVFVMTGRGAMPETADAPSAKVDAFIPMLDAFNHAVIDAEEDLLALVDQYELAPLSASQVLDRLLWFDSWGHRVIKTPFEVLDDDGVYAVLPRSQPRAQ